MRSNSYSKMMRIMAFVIVWLLLIVSMECTEIENENKNISEPAFTFDELYDGEIMELPPQLPPSLFPGRHKLHKSKPISRKENSHGGVSNDVLHDLGYPILHSENSPTESKETEKSQPAFSVPSGGKSKPDSSASSKRGSIANWVFITIGAAVVAVAVSIFLLSYVFRRSMAMAPKREQKDKTKFRGPDALLSVNITPTGDDDDDYGVYELETYCDGESTKPLNKSGAPVICDEYECCDMGESLEMYQSNKVHVDKEDARIKNLRDIISTRCVSAEPEEKDMELSKSSSSIYNMVKKDGNKLRGGNSEFDRCYVDTVYVSNDITPAANPYKSAAKHQRSNSWRRLKTGLKLASPGSENGWNGSSSSSTTSHHSARSYISIPPTSPSDRYIEAGSDCLLLRSDKSAEPFKMEWLTKSLATNSKNELCTYQASTGVQTESTVPPPTTKTVLGTPWQFGGAFTSQGGILQAGESDVVLTVPANAVPKAEAVDIYGSIFTDTAALRKRLDFPKVESLVTPVVEYIAVPSNNFQRLMSLHLPHALPADFDIDSVKVYTFTVDDSGRVTISVLPFRNSSDQADAFWEKDYDGSKILISTSHFSGYFCTLCKSRSLPSICTMVFGSHVEIGAQHRREIRVILYIWDRRLTIRDYLERFRKQESEVDRQLLTDMQVPLLDDASSDSRLVMRMEFLGSEEDRQCWRHVARPGGSRLLFKPLQVRRLSEIVQCCRQTDPIRVEWAVENKPEGKPGPVFQCCIDIMHAPESTCDYEAALSEDLDDLMRTFYVRDLKVTPRQNLTSSSSFEYEPGKLKRTLSGALDLKQTEQLCLELGFASKDIGNFHKKFPTESAVQVELVEECVRRLGPEKMIAQLPSALEKLQLLHVLKALEREAVLDDRKEPVLWTVGPSAKPAPTQHTDNAASDSSMTYIKQAGNSREKPCNVTKNGSDNRKAEEKSKNTNIYQPRPGMQQQVSQRSDDVFLPASPRQDPIYYNINHSNNASGYACGGGEHRFDAESTSSYSPPSSRSDNFSYQYQAPTKNNNHNNNNSSNSGRSKNHTNMVFNKARSSSGYESVNQHEDITSSMEDATLSDISEHDRQSFPNFSVQAFADSTEPPESSLNAPPSLPSSQRVSVGDGQAYAELSENNLYRASSGPSNFKGQGLTTNGVRNIPSDEDQTSKKELYGIHTVV